MSPAFKVHRNAALRAPRRRHRSQPVTTTRVPADAMAKARELAGGDLRRLRVVDARTVLVTNQPKAGAR